MELRLPFTNIILYSDEPGDHLAPDLPDVVEYLERDDLIRYHTLMKRSIKTAPGCYVVRFYEAIYAGRVVAVEGDTIAIRYYDPQRLLWQRAETTADHIELVLKANADL